MKKRKELQSGVALLMALGILTMLTIMGVTFATKMRLSEEISRNFLYNVQARYITEAGVQYTIAALEADARSNFVFNGMTLSQPTGAGSELLDGQGQFTVSVVDAASRLYVNKFSASELLDTALVDVGPVTASAITSACQLYGGFKTPASVNLAAGSNIYGSNEETMTVFGYIDENTQDESGNNEQRAALNINTVFDNTNGNALVEDLITAVSGVLGAAPAVTTALETYAASNSYESWTDFDQQIDSVISGSQATDTKESFNPNRWKPGWDSGAAGTDFCFHSGGVYEISVSGTLNKNGNQIASKTVTAAAKIFDLWNMTTREQFRGEDTNYDGNLDTGEDVNDNGSLDSPDYNRVTWFDSCPVDMSQYNSYSFDPSSDSVDKINDSIKIGYWDDFGEDPNYSYGNDFSIWKNRVPGDPTISVSSGVLDVNIDADHASGKDHALINLGEYTLMWYHDDFRYWFRKWRWEYFSVWAKLNDAYDTGNHGYYFPNLHCRAAAVPHLFIRSSSTALGDNRQYDIYISKIDNLIAGDPNECDSVHRETYLHQNEYPEYAMIRYRNKIDYSTVTTNLTGYKTGKIFKVSCTQNGIKDNLAVTAYYSGGSTSLSPNPDPDHNDINEVGLIGLFSMKTGFTLDNVRIIGGETVTSDEYPRSPEGQLFHPAAGIPRPYYISSVFQPLDSGTVEWGNVYATVTIPDTADGTSEGVYLYTLTDSVNTWGFRGQNSGSDSCSIISPITDAGGNNVESSDIRWRIDMDTSDADFSETPVLEDVWVTYIEPVKILYWKES